MVRGPIRKVGSRRGKMGMAEKGRAALLKWGSEAEPPRVEGLSNTYGVLIRNITKAIVVVKILLPQCGNKYDFHDPSLKNA